MGIFSRRDEDGYDIHGYDKKGYNRAGFDKIGTMKDYYFANGKYLDRILYWKVLE